MCGMKGKGRASYHASVEHHFGQMGRGFSRGEVVVGMFGWESGLQFLDEWWGP